MKVIKYGKIQPKLVMCPNCEALLEYTESDLEHKSSWNGRFSEERISLCCPVCDQLMLVELYQNGLHYVRHEDGKLELN